LRDSVAFRHNGTVPHARSQLARKINAMTDEYSSIFNHACVCSLAYSWWHTRPDFCCATLLRNLSRSKVARSATTPNAAAT